MHEWAITVERVGGRLREDLKSGRGPEEVRRFFEDVSLAMALEERGQVVDDELMARIVASRADAAPWLTKGSK